MRRFILIVLVLVGVIAAFAVYLWVTTPRESAGVKFPLTASQAALLARVPKSADAFALVPTAALLRAKLEANPVTRDPIQQWAAQQQQLPEPWLLGGGDVVAWKNGKVTSYALSVDPVRAFLIRTWLMLSGGIEARFDGSAFIINGRTEPTLTSADLAPLLELAKGLPPGDVFVVQMEGGRGMYPPIGRPAVSSASITPEEILVTSRAASDATSANATQVELPNGALIAATFGDPPRLIGDLRRILRFDVAAMVENGGTIALYDIDAGTLLPRPEGLIAVPATAESREAMSIITAVADLVGETRDTGEQLLVSFDRKSLGLYSKDTFAPLPWPANRWGARMDPQRLIPVLERLGDNTGLRIAASRLHRAARDLRQWIRYLQHAKMIEAADSAAGGFEELRVRIASK